MYDEWSQYKKRDKQLKENEEKYKRKKKDFEKEKKNFKRKIQEENSKLETMRNFMELQVEEKASKTRDVFQKRIRNEAFLELRSEIERERREKNEALQKVGSLQKDVKRRWETEKFMRDTLEKKQQLIERLKLEKVHLEKRIEREIRRKNENEEKKKSKKMADKHVQCDPPPPQPQPQPQEMQIPLHFDFYQHPHQQRLQHPQHHQLHSSHLQHHSPRQHQQQNHQERGNQASVSSVNNRAFYDLKRTLVDVISDLDLEMKAVRIGMEKVQRGFESQLEDSKRKVLQSYAEFEKNI